MALKQHNPAPANPNSLGLLAWSPSKSGGTESAQLAINFGTYRRSVDRKPNGSDSAVVAVGHSVTCESCGQPYVIKRFRADRPRRLCVTCRGRTGGTEGAVTFIVPSSTPAERVRANGLINMRVRTGMIVKPKACQWCGKERRLDSHHPDYGQPDLIVWLCRSDHMKCHRDSAFEKKVARLAENTGAVQTKNSNIGISGPKPREAVSP